MVRADYAIATPAEEVGASLRMPVAQASPDRSRRLEDWIVSALGDDHGTATEDLWAGLVGTPTAKRRTKRNQADPSAPAGWQHFQISRRRGVTIVHLTDRSLTRWADLEELAGDLLALVEAGHQRMVLHFGAVERLSSALAGIMAEVQRRCARSPGGSLRVCGVRPGLDILFRLTGLDRSVMLAPNESAAVDDPWPGAPEFLPLPVDVLQALTGTGGTDGGVENRSGWNRKESRECGGRHIMTRVRLVIEVGRARGKAVAVNGPRFLIGRDASCHLRPGAATVSRLHAAIEFKGPRIYLRDLGSANGTLLNGQALRDSESELHDGDRVEAGAFRFTVSLARAEETATKPAPRLAAVDDLIADCLQGQPESDPEPGTLLDIEAATQDGAPAGEPLAHKVIEGVLVVTPLTDQLDGERTLETLRSRLNGFVEGGELPRRVVINLAHVRLITGRAIGVLVAHHIRLDRSGGSLRVCEANPRVAAVLDQVRLAMLVPCHASVDDAVLSAWPGETAGAGV